MDLLGIVCLICSVRGRKKLDSFSAISSLRLSLSEGGIDG